jgi:hypothetical protein
MNAFRRLLRDWFIMNGNYDFIKTRVILVEKTGLFFGSVAISLLMTAFAKLISASGSSHILESVDPIIPLRIRQLLWLVSAIEVVVALALVTRMCDRWKLYLIVWLSVQFIGYRFMAYLRGGQSHCPCLGNVTDSLHISPGIAEGFLLALIAYMLLGSLIFLAALRTVRVPAVEVEASV